MDVMSNAVLPEWLFQKYSQLGQETWDMMKAAILEIFPDAANFRQETTRHERLLNSDYEVVMDFPVVEMTYIATVED